MNKKLLCILTGYLSFFLLGLISCEKCGPFPEKFKLVGFDVNTVSAIYSQTGEQEISLQEITNDTIKYDLYSISIDAKIKALVNTGHKNNSLDLINSAFACSPGVLKTDERIKSILITSDKDFDATHPSGTDLSELFDIVVYDDANNINNEKFKLKDYISTKPSVPNTMILILNSSPALSQNFEFTLNYHQQGIDIDFLEFKTKKVFIEKE